MQSMAFIGQTGHCLPPAGRRATVPRSVAIERSRLRTVSALALPIIAGMSSQTLLNLVDTFMVSRLGKVEVAAVGLGGFANFMATAFITGMSAGVQAAAARRKGEGRVSETAVPLNGGLVLVAALAIPASAVLFLLTPALFPILADDPAVIGVGVPYLQSRLVGMLALGCNFAFRGYWNGVSLSRLYLRTLVVMHVSNVLLSYALIFGAFGMPELGATGAGIGTMVSTYIGTGYYVYLGVRHARGAGFLRAFPDRSTLRSMLRLSLPSGAQQFFYAFGLTMLFRIVGMIGTAELAAANVILDVTMVAFLPGLGLGLAAASLVGQALGRRDVDDAERWGWDVVKVGTVILVCLSVPMIAMPRWIVGAFFPEAPDAIEVAATPLRLAGASMAVEAMGIILINSIMGAGATKLAMSVSIGLQWGVLLPAAYLAGPLLGFGLVGVWAVNVGFRALFAATCALCWRRRWWAGARI